MLRLIGVAILVLAITGTVAAQQEKGDKELQFNANATFMTGNGASSGEGSANILLGYYMTRQLEIRGGLGVALTQVQICSQSAQVAGTLECTGFSTELGGAPTLTAGFVFNIMKKGQKFYPYLGVDYTAIGVFGAPQLTQVSANQFKSHTPLDWTNNVRPNGGVKYFFKRNVAFDLNVGYDATLGDDNSGVHTIDTRIGFSYVF